METLLEFIVSTLIILTGFGVCYGILWIFDRFPVKDLGEPVIDIYYKDED